MESARPRLAVLLLADDDPAHANTILEHIGALTQLSRHDIVVYNPRGVTKSVALDLDEFDAIVLHYSIVSIQDPYLAPWLREGLRRFGGLKMQMIQDDYRSVDEFRAMIRHLGITVLFTLVPEREIESVWPSHELPGVERITTLAGYVPLGAGDAPVPRLGDRPLDIVYRGRSIPYWIGRLGQEKAWIAQGVAERAARHGLRVDVDWREGARIYGQSWLQFLSSGRATLGAESGASITDFDGSIERRTRAYLREHPDAGFDEVHREVLHAYEGNVMMNIISPRVFESASVRTALVQFPGEYSGALEPDVHYIPLAKDFSNFDEVVERLRDLPTLEAMTTTAFDELIASGRYSIRRFVERFDRALDEHAVPRRAARRRLRFAAAQVERPLRLQAERTLTAIRDRTGPSVTDAAGKAALGFGLVVRTPALRKLLRRYLVDSLVRRPAVASPRAVLEDLLKLALVHRLRTGKLNCSPPIEVVVEVGDSEEELILRSLPITRPPNAPGGTRPAAGSVATPALRRVIWDHSAVGSTLRWSSPLGPSVDVVIGQPGGSGIHEFVTFPELATRFPAETADALSLAAAQAAMRSGAPAAAMRSA